MVKGIPCTYLPEKVLCCYSKDIKAIDGPFKLILNAAQLPGLLITLFLQSLNELLFSISTFSWFRGESILWSG